DDRWLAAGQGTGDVGAVVWDGHTGEKRVNLWPLRNRAMKVHALAFAHDSSVLAGAWADATPIKLWHCADGRETTLAAGPGVNRAVSVALSPSARQLAAGFDPALDGKGRPYLKVWDLDTDREPFAFKAEHSGK